MCNNIKVTFEQGCETDEEVNCVAIKGRRYQAERRANTKMLKQEHDLWVQGISGKAESTWSALSKEESGR